MTFKNIPERSYRLKILGKGAVTGKTENVHILCIKLFLAAFV
jgi:hypothetical protein